MGNPSNVERPARSQTHLPFLCIARQKGWRFLLVADTKVILDVSSRCSSLQFRQFIRLALVIIMSTLLNYSSGMGKVSRAYGLKGASSGGYLGPRASICVSRLIWKLRKCLPETLEGPALGGVHPLGAAGASKETRVNEAIVLDFLGSVA